MGFSTEARLPLWMPVLLAIGYFAAGLLSYWFSSSSGAFAESVFIHEGFGLAVTLLVGRMAWGSVFAGHLALSLYQGMAPGLALVVALGNLTVVVLLSSLLQRLKFRCQMDTPRDYLLLALGVTLISQPVARLLALATMRTAMHADITLETVVEVFKFMWLDESVCQILVATCILSGVEVLRRHRPVSFWLTLLLATGLLVLVLAQLLLVPDYQWLHPLHVLSIVYLLVMIVAAVFELFGAAVANIIVLGSTQWATHKGLGPFYQLVDSGADLTNMNTFLVGIILSSCLVGALLRERSDREAMLEQLAHHDSLTGLYNRRYFFELAERELLKARREATQLTLFWMDLDHFKAINDKHGHAAGDRALAFFAGVLQRQCRRTDLAARMGGEEFAVLTWGSVDVQALAEKVRNTLQRELPQHREVVPFTVSIGVTTFRPEDQRVEDMMHRADIALYQAKAAGKHRHVFADERRIHGTSQAAW